MQPVLLIVRVPLPSRLSRWKKRNLCAVAAPRHTICSVTRRRKPPHVPVVFVVPAAKHAASSRGGPLSRTLELQIVDEARATEPGGAQRDERAVRRRWRSQVGGAVYAYVVRTKTRRAQCRQRGLLRRIARHSVLHLSSQRIERLV